MSAMSPHSVQPISLAVRGRSASRPWIFFARRWNDANVLALSLRATSQAQLGEILDAWFAAGPSADAEDAANIAHLADIER